MSNQRYSRRFASSIATFSSSKTPFQSHADTRIRIAGAIESSVIEPGRFVSIVKLPANAGGNH